MDPWDPKAESPSLLTMKQHPFLHFALENIMYKSLVEETESHIIVLLLRFLLLLFLLGLLGRRVTLAGCGGSGDELGWILEVLLGHIGSLEGDVGGDSNGNEVLETVDNAVGSRGSCWVTDLEGHSGDIAYTLHEAGPEIIRSDVEDFRGEDGSAIVHGFDDKTVREGRNIQHVEKGGFRSPDLVSNLDKVDVVDDFNCTFGNLGRDVQSLEERSLLRTKTGVLGWNLHINWGDSTCSRGCLNLVVDDLLSNFTEIFLGEDESNISADAGKEFFQIWVVLNVTLDRFPHHGVLAHEEYSGSTKGDTDLLHLFGSDIVNSDDEAFGVFVHKLNQLQKVIGLPCLPVPLNHLD